MEKGSKVWVSPASFPMHEFPGVIIRAGRRPGIWRVRYESFGASYTQEFFEIRLKERA